MALANKVSRLEDPDEAEAGRELDEDGRTIAELKGCGRGAEGWARWAGDRCGAGLQRGREFRAENGRGRERGRTMQDSTRSATLLGHELRV